MNNPYLHVNVKDTGVKKKNIKAFSDALDAIKDSELPDFDTYTPDLGAIKTLVEKYAKDVESVIVISNGGSRNNPKALYDTLWAQRNDRQVFFLSSQDPDYIEYVKDQVDKDETLVMPISKSGTNVDMLEPLAQFLDDGWNILPITSPEQGVLFEMAKHYGWDIIPHPSISGRYSGRTETGLAPAQAMGLDINKINEGALKMYEACRPDVKLEDNPALELAAHFAALEDQDYLDVFVPVYSSKLVGFLPLIVQLLHESTGKDGKGQTFFGDEAPESQHHTNQRFFGGRDNVAGLIFTVDDFDEHKRKTKIPKAIEDLPLRDGTLKDLDGIKLGDAINFDEEGVHKTAIDKGIPHAVISVHKINEEVVGAVLGFLQYFTYYSALLRAQDPFDQPEVEDSKELSWQLRKQHS